jgi:hypothetical protein
MRRGQPLVVPPCKIHAQARKDEEGAVVIEETSGDGDKTAPTIVGMAGEGAGEATKGKKIFKKIF